MAIPINEFWKAAIAAQLFSLDEARQLHQTFVQTPGAKHANSVTLAEWLVAQSMLTRYHAQMLLAGKTGPCLVGSYKIQDRLRTGPLVGLYRATHTQTGVGALLYGIEPALNAAAGPAANRVAAIQLFEAKFGLVPPVIEYLRIESADPNCWLVLEDISARVELQAKQAKQPPRAAVVAASPAPQLISSQPVPVVAVSAAKSPSAVGAQGGLDVPIIVNRPAVVAHQPAAGTVSPALAAYQARRRKQSAWVPIAVAAVLIAGVGYSMYLLSRSGKSTDDAQQSVVSRPPSSHRLSTPTDLTTVPAVPAGDIPRVERGKLATNDKPATVLIEDDGHTLWAAPAQGPPVDLRYIAPGAQLFFVVRPAGLLGNEEGERVFAALGPWGEAAIDFAQRTLGFPLSEIERLLVAWYPTDGDLPLASYVVTLRQASTEAQLLQAWHQPKPIERNGRKYFSGGSLAYYLPSGTGDRVFVIAPVPLMEEIVAHGSQPVLRKEMEKLLRDTDETRYVNLLMYPNFLFSDGATFLSGPFAKLKGPLKDYFGEGIQAAALSMHLAGDDSFYELRTMGTVDVSTIERANLYRQRLHDLPMSVETYLAQLNPQKYGSMLLIRMPRMIGELANYTRIGEENGQSVLRCYLPATAAHNLVMATELALAEQPGGVAVAQGPTAEAAPPPANLAEKLKQKISLSFPRNTLEKCMEMLGEELGVPVQILGSDLQLEGITKNQSFGLEERNQPAEEILKKVMLLANPDGKLVYVIKPAADGTEQLIITTRAAVAKRGDKLPPSLEQPATNN